MAKVASISRASSRGVILLIALMAVISVISQVQGQFFTKTSSTIPRMGRRSDADNSIGHLNQLRRLLIDELLDEYGPELFELIRARKAAKKQTGGEVTMRNDQPIDWVRLTEPSDE